MGSIGDALDNAIAEALWARQMLHQSRQPAA